MSNGSLPLVHPVKISPGANGEWEVFLRANVGGLFITSLMGTYTYLNEILNILYIYMLHTYIYMHKI